MNIHRFRFGFALLAISTALGSLGACNAESGGGAGDGEDGEAVWAIDLETGERREFGDADEVPDGWALCDGELCPDPLECAVLGQAVCLGRADCAALYGADGEFGGCTDGGPTCALEDCGPAPGMPAIECPDGSLGGHTGRCIATDDGCGWEVRECPDPSCDEDACGPSPGMPAEPCEDGSVGGNTGACLANPDGTCSWEVRECPEDGCAVDACGPPPPGVPCADGSSTVGDCAEGADGVCGWQLRECPETLCDEADCGPMPGMPATTCEDGSIGGNTGRCILYDGGVCGWENRECPEDAG